ncbi:phage major capsid protein [Demequina sp. TTPB684]|uniref:phage major capsid family protein n=1 Tax=unclassified Demequina TaxID=2620311 RepID=UPI001CF502C6|nr:MULTISPECIES: phage major capsid protein [unclassified Demequina]MCB2412356.1 phage major capsid protein [Demequina sp. TTPB684]UPU89026.1 phage major capsid protein [Demequina sp. TMPB413]
MASLTSASLELPKHMAKGIFEEAQLGSTIAALSGAKPMLFGESQSMTFSNPKAQFVGEGAQKSHSPVTPSIITVKPYKTQVTMRFNEEVKWADEDYQLGVLQQLADKSGPALARALDLGVYHGVNPLTGLAFAAITKFINQSTNRVETAGASIADLDAAEALVAGIPNGAALDPTYAKGFRSVRDSEGRRMFPDLRLQTEPTDLDGYTTSVSDTISASEEVAVDTGIRGFVGDYSQIYWGVQRKIGVRMIEFGDPDGEGDLQQFNQIALRAELVYGWVIGDLDRFAVIEDQVA